MSGKIQLYLGEPSPKVKTWIERHHAPPLPYDAEIMYLESTGTQLVNTGIYGRDNLLCNIRFALTSTSINDNRYIFVGYEGRSLLGIFAQGSSQLFRFGAVSSIVGGASLGLDLDIHEAYIDTTSTARRVVFDGIVVYSGTGSYQSQYSNPIGLFGRIGYDNGSSARIYSFSVTDATTGQKIQDLIPVRKNGMGYMYDRVSGQLLGNSGTDDFVLGPDKPYDYEVAYIERDCSVPWVDANGSEITGYFDLSRYSYSGETLGTMRPLETTWSFEPISAGYVWAVYRQNGLLQRGAMKVSDRTVYSFVNASSGHTSTEGNLGVFHKQRQEYKDGHIMGYIDGVLIMDVETSGSSKFQNLSIMRSSITTSSSYYGGKMRVSNVRVGSDVYLIPVVKGNAVGFYNMVDGELFLEEQACLAAGP